MKLRTAFKRNLREEDGSFSVEAILMFPLLAWAFIGMYVFFEGLRESNINLKAAYTVSDLLSRQEEVVINDDYMEGMHRIYAWLSRSAQPVQLRVTVIRYDEASDEHQRLWSEGVGVEGLDQAAINANVTPHVPILADTAVAIVVETWAKYEPIVDVGLDNTELYNIVVTTPRFAGQLLYEGIGDGTGDVHVDGPEEEAEGNDDIGA